MKLTSEKVEHTFVPLLQHYVKITCEGKKIREGKLLLVSQKASYISIVLADTMNEPKILELPYPFNYSYILSEHHVCFDYTINTLCNTNIQSQRLVHDKIGDKRHRFLDKRLYFNCVDIVVKSR